MYNEEIVVNNSNKCQINNRYKCLSLSYNNSKVQMNIKTGFIGYCCYSN